MGTTIRPEVSVKNKYWIDKHRHYELKHFCLQYPRWKKLYIYLDNKTTISPKLYEVKGNSGKVDMTARIAIDKDMYYDRYRKFFWILSNKRNRRKNRRSSLYGTIC